MLTTQQIKMIRSADTICVDFINRNGEETSQLRLIKKREDDFSEYEQTETIPVDVQFDSFDKDYPMGKYGKEKPTSCFYHEPQYSWSKHGIGAVANFLRKNDKLTFVWRFGNTSENTKYAKTKDGERLYCYEFILKVTRGENTSEFLIESKLSPMNLASMIRFY